MNNQLKIIIHKIISIYEKLMNLAKCIFHLIKGRDKPSYFNNNLINNKHQAKIGRKNYPNQIKTIENRIEPFFF